MGELYRIRCADGACPTFLRTLEQFGPQAALVDEAGAVVSYAELAARADRDASVLGDGRQFVLIDAVNSVASVLAYVGALRQGHVVLLAAGGRGDDRLADCWQPNFVHADGGWRHRAAAPAHRLHDDLALLLSTSGTTGATKLVRLAGTALDANARSIAEYLGIEPSDRALTTLPFHYSYGLSVINSHLAAGAALLLTDRSVVDPALLPLVDDLGATSLAGVPYTYELLDRARFMERAPASLRTLTQAGGRMPPEDVRRYGAWAAATGRRFFVMYGQTEATARMAYLPPDTLARYPDCIGRPIPGGAFELVDPDGAAIAAAETPGELVYRGANVMMGYALVPADLGRGHELEALHTGDIAVRNAAGWYRIVGRKSRFVKPLGLRVALDEVEATMLRHGWRGIAAGDDTIIAVQVMAGTEPRLVARTLAAAFKLPVALFHVEAVADLPVLASGKIDYRVVLLAAKAARAAAAAAPDDPVMAAFAHAFPDRVLQPGDSFISLGGDSLRYVGVSLALEEALGTLPPGWETLPLASLAGRQQPLPPTRRPTAGIDMEILLRAAAIIAVVVNHSSSFIVGGGASALMLLAGLNLGRFQRNRLVAGDGVQVVLSFASRVVVPYYAILIPYLLFKQKLDWPALLMVGNFYGRFGTLLEPYWFIQVIVQIYLIVAVLFLFAPVRRAARDDPWRFGIWCLICATALKIVGHVLFHNAALANRTPDAMLYLVALGWCVQFADTRARRAALAAVGLVFAVLILTALPPMWSPLPTAILCAHALWIAAPVVLLLWVPRVRVPHLVRNLIGTIAAASFYIYLAHGLPVHIFHTEYDLARIGLALAGSLIAGLLVQQLLRTLDAAAAQLRRAAVPLGG